MVWFFIYMIMMIKINIIKIIINIMMIKIIIII